MDLTKTLTNPDNILAVVVAVITFATIVTVAKPMMGGADLNRRMKSVGARREELKRRSRQAMAREGKEGSIRQNDEGFYKKIVDRLNLKTLLEDPKVVLKLAQAGYRGPHPITTFYFFRFLMPFVFFVAIGVYLFAVNSFGLPPITRVCAMVVGLVVGYYAPNVFVSNVASKRRASIMQAFPDALDLLLICVESGMSIEAAIQKVSREIGGRSMELAEELSLLSAELSYLPERRMAYEALSQRTNHPGVKSVATAMIQAEKYGTPLGNALRVMAKENRDLRLAAAEKKAASLPAQLTVPMILFFLPVLFVVILGPAIIQVQNMMKH